MTVKIAKKSQGARTPNCVDEAIEAIYGQSTRTVRLVRAVEADRWNRLVEKHHYLKNASMVGESLRYVAEQDGQWVALLGWSSAVFHVQARDQFIGWNAIQRQRRRHLLACNARFVLLGPKRKAAWKGDAYAQGQLGELYRDGRGVEKDMSEAVRWLRKAAARGDRVHLRMRTRPNRFFFFGLRRGAR
ncbi:MAG: DUF4338 domain-containing protein, partial [Verrucomicrobia bacterium]|nr:DUF4338 domain-containing protein [Verrucomicrobiota bacterium]